MTPNEYQSLAMRTLNDISVGRHRMYHATEAVQLYHAAAGIVKEGGEVLSLLEKWIFYGGSISRDEVIKELGDVLWYTAEACDCLGVTLEDVMRINIAKLKARYPDGFSEERADRSNRDLTEESDYPAPNYGRVSEASDTSDSDAPTGGK